MDIRKSVGQTLKRQADKMLLLSSVKSANIDDNAVVKISDIDLVKFDDRKKHYNFSVSMGF